MGSNNAARSHVLRKTMTKCSSGSFLSQLFTYILARIASLVRTVTGKGMICVYVRTFMCKHGVPILVCTCI